MGHRDFKRHRGAADRPMEHRLAGGHHRKKNDGCLGAFLFMAGTAGAMLVGAGHGVAALIQALV